MNSIKPTTLNNLFSIAAKISIAASIFLIASMAAAQNFPNKTIKIIIPFSSGTPADTLTRVIASRLQLDLKQPVVIENRPGAGGVIAIQEVLRLPNDGYTLVAFGMPITVANALQKNPSYDLMKDFQPLLQTAWSYNILVTPANSGVGSIKELIEKLKAEPGKYSYSSGGLGTPAQVAGKMFEVQAQVSALHTPYNQLPQAIGDLVGGQHLFMFAATAPVTGFITSGRLKPLAVSSPERLANFKDVPTMSEVGFPNFLVRDWQGIAVRSGAPVQVTEVLTEALIRARESNEVKSVIATMGASQASGNSADFVKLFGSELKTWSEFSKKVKLD